MLVIMVPLMVACETAVGRLLVSGAERYLLLLLFVNFHRIFRLLLSSRRVSVDSGLGDSW